MSGSIHRLWPFFILFLFPRFNLPPSPRSYSLLLDFILRGIDIAYGNQKKPTEVAFSLTLPLSKVRWNLVPNYLRVALHVMFKKWCYSCGFNDSPTAITVGRCLYKLPIMANIRRIHIVKSSRRWGRNSKFKSAIEHFFLQAVSMRIS